MPQPFSQPVTFPSGLPKEVDIADTAPPIPAEQKIRIGQIAEKMVLDLFSPTAVLIDPKGDILHVQGRTGKYMETTSGQPSRNILDMNPKPLAGIDQAGVAVTANKAFERLTNIPREQIEGCNLLDIAGGVLKNGGIDVHLRSDLDEGATV